MLEIIKFLLFILLFLYFPGKIILTHLKISFPSLTEAVISIALGIPILTFLFWFTGYLQISFLVLPFLILIDLVFLRKRKLAFPAISKKSLKPFFIILIGATFQFLLMLKSGTFYNGGLAFWGVHGYDAIWHCALIQELSVHFPPQNPGFAGELLKNYHYLTDLFYAVIHNFTGISILDLYFRLAPVLLAVILNSLIFIFVRNWSKNEKVAAWAIFFTSIAGSFGWIPPLFNKGSNNWETAFWGMQPTSAFLNPPFAISLIILMVNLILIEKYFTLRNRNLLPIIIFQTGILFGFKIYAGIIFLSVLGIFGLFELMKKRLDLIITTLMSGILALGIYLPASSGSLNYLVWQPWWFIQTMIEAPDRLNWSSLELRRQVYALHNNWRNIFLLQAMAFVIFLTGNLGTRISGFLTFLLKIIKGKTIDRFLILLALIAFFPPIFFIQKVVPWNSIQFLYYFIFLFSFFAAESLVICLAKVRYKLIKVTLILVLIGTSMPSTLETIHWFTAPVPTTLLNKEEVEALDILKREATPKDIILTYPYDSYVQRSFKNPPVPMTYYNSPYVSFFTQKRVYLEDLNSATLLSYDINGRLQKENEFFSTVNVKIASDFLKGNQISYVYLVDKQKTTLDPEQIGLVKIFDNTKVRIYKVI